jgi:hypothetical protein
MLAVGLALTVVGVIGLTSEDDTADEAAPTAPTSTATGSPEASATATSEADTDALVRSFFADLRDAVRAGELERLGPQLHRAVIERYGQQACNDDLARRQGDPSFDVEVVDIDAPAAWDYTTDEITTMIDEAVAVTLTITENDEPAASQAHVIVRDGSVQWFTDCGEPQG